MKTTKAQSPSGDGAAIRQTKAQERTRIIRDAKKIKDRTSKTIYIKRIDKVKDGKWSRN